MPLINCRVESKLKWIKYYVLATGGVDNSNADRNNIVFDINDRKLYIPAVTLSSKDDQKLSIAPTSDSKIQKMKSVCNGSIEIANESKRKSNKSWVDQKWLVDNGILMYLTYNEGKSVVLEKFIRTLTGKIYKKMTVNDSKT